MVIKTVGRRKCSVAFVKIVSGQGNFIVNKKSINEYFQNNPNCVFKQQFFSF